MNGIDPKCCNVIGQRAKSLCTAVHVSASTVRECDPSVCMYMTQCDVGHTYWWEHVVLTVSEFLKMVNSCCIVGCAIELGKSLVFAFTNFQTLIASVLV